VRASAPQSAGERVWPNGDTSGGPGRSDPTRTTFFRVPLGNILMTAFDVPANRLKAPEWTANIVTPATLKNVSEVTPAAFRYDITATMPPGATKAQSHEMLRNLLIDRFKPTYHLEKKDFDGYMATVAKGGVKLKLSAAVAEPKSAPLVAKVPLGPDGFADVPAGEPAIVATIVDGSRKVRWSVRKIPVSSLLEMLKVFYPLAARLGEPESSADYIFDDTGLKGDVRLQIRIPAQSIPIWSRP
jgi:uncharacterized protein (TIGR03435 family)